MKLYLVRHAHAVSEEEDANRPLSPRGREVALAMAEWIAPVITDDLAGILTSPLVRAKETARIFADAFGMQKLVREVKGLQPEDDPEVIQAVLENRTAPLMLIGHEPHLGRLASLLVTGNRDHPLLIMKKGSVVCLRGENDGDGTWVLEWALKPKLLPGCREE